MADNNTTFSYTTPQQNYNNAAEFTTVTTNNPEELSRKVNSFIRTLNDSQLLYPTIANVIVVLLIVIILFQKSIGNGVKIFVSIVLVAFLAYTIYLFRGRF